MENKQNAACRQCRREGQKLFLKGTKCYTEKCAFGGGSVPNNSKTKDDKGG